jgi:formylglycine-generating enzyme required for sulfatase activity
VSAVIIERDGGRQTVAVDRLPLSIGGESCDLEVSGLAFDDAAAYIGHQEGDFYLQPAHDNPRGLTVNGVPLTASRWLAEGDQLALSSTRIRCGVEGNTLILDFADPSNPAMKPPPRASSAQPGSENVLVSPIPFTPRWQTQPPRRALRIRPRLIAAVVLFTLLAAGAWFVLSAHALRIETNPEGADISVSGGLKIKIGDRYLLRPGSYTIEARYPGYLDLNASLAVDSKTPPEVRFDLDPLGTVLSLTTRPVAGAAVAIDGQDAGTTPIDGYQLSAGHHSIEVRAERHLPYQSELEVAPGDDPLDLVVELEPNWAPVSIKSAPSGAAILIDGEQVGSTPATAEVESGQRVMGLRLRGFKDQIRRIQVTTGQPLDLGTIRLDPLDGTLAVVSEPNGATITIDGQFQGTTPLELKVAPNTTHKVGITLAGHASHSAEVTVGAGQRSELRATLEMLTGEVVVSSQPPGATVIIDGVERGTTEQRYELESRPHDIEVRLEGWVPYTVRITPQPGFAQAVHAELRQEGPAGLAKRVTSPQGVDLVLVSPARFTMGAARREPGRRSNEVLREVEITQPFYLAVREVSNQEFREFKGSHRSGGHGGHNLEIDHHPVVNVTWEDAARYCNWLSEKAGLTPVYVERGGTLSPRNPMPNGFRLPTETEWALAARFAASAKGLKYVWGDQLPVPSGGGNYGDSTAAATLGGAVPNYRDGYAATAPVGSFKANPSGIFNLGGNVSEWVQDFYTLVPTTPGTVEKDPIGPATGRGHVIRGSSWMDTSVTELRLSYRDFGADARPDLGFRIARSAQ